ncbi:MAG: ribosomal RNA small subunit methyltransferase A [Caldilineaceae bacterium]|nr:ribosomal RNA small subunit methyltransferase A [Caldilineaceae bacterium]
MIDTFELIRRYQLNPKRSLAQNFLTDAHHLARIAAAAELVATDTVLEIGPGLGSLTQYLAAQAGRVLAVELDDRLIELLRAHFADRPQVQIIHGDILALDPSALVAQATHPADGLVIPGAYPAAVPYKVVANLPYYITSAVLRHLLEASWKPSQIVVLVQQEVAERICAQPGALSLLAVSVQYYAQPHLVQRVPAGAFYPPPKVDSAVLRLDVRAEPAVADIPPERFFTVVRAGFSQKRKQLANTLSAGLHLPKAELMATLTQLGIDPQRRAETLTLAEWGLICRALAGE